MPFDDISNRRFTDHRPADSEVCMALYTKDSRAYSLMFQVGPEILGRLNWQIGDRVHIREGHGTDAGLFKIVKSDTSDGHKLTPTGSRSRYGAVKVANSILRHHTTGEVPQPLAPVQFQAFGGELLLMAPEWMVAKGA